MTTSNGKTQERYNEIGEVTEFHMEKYSVVKVNVPDLFIKYQLVSCLSGGEWNVSKVLIYFKGGS